MPAAVRRLLRAAAITSAVVLVYATGVVTGVVGTRTTNPPAPPPPAAPSAPPGVIDEAADRIAAAAARPVDRAALERAAVQAMLAEIGDPWSGYYGPSEAGSRSDALDGRYNGVGLWLRAGGPTGVEVGSVAPGSPADRAGLAPGDAIVRLDGRPPVAGVAAAAQALRGAGPASVGQVVEIVIRRAGVDRTVTLPRVSFAASDVAVERLPDSVTLVRIGAFTRGVGRQLREVLRTDRPAYAGGVLLDLRGNPGGLLDEAVEVASAFLDGGPVVSYERRGQSRRTLEALSRGDTATPVVVLLDRGTASAAEVVAAALQDRGRAVLVGSRSHGKGTVQEPARLSDGSTIELTVGRYLTPAGRSLDRLGVAPDVLVPDDAGRDVGERRAVEVLAGLVAALPPSGRG
jgi:carboxyl-terminal processing protease